MKSFFTIFIFLGYQLILNGTGFFVSGDANNQGDGSFIKPWTFQTALNHPLTLMPGDTVWMLGGVYKNVYDNQTSFSCKTNGTSNAPIIFRNFNHERVTLDGELLYTLYLGLGNCSYTWFWGLEITNSSSSDRNHDIPGGLTCTAENMKFINMVVHDTGSGLDTWKSAKNTETYGCIIYHIGNNLNNNGNLEGHGHGMYLQNDTFGTKKIHDNIVFSTYGYGIKIWQTTTTAAIGNFDIQGNIVFNGGSASENLGGVGNNYRTHNIFALSNGPNNPLANTVFKHNFTFAGNNMPRPPVNAFGLNYGVKNFVLDSNYLTGQTRLGFNNTPIFQASVKDNTIMGGIPSVYGVYLWGFLQSDFPNNTYVPQLPNSGLEYFVIPNKYENGRAHIAIYNWDSAATVQLDLSGIGLQAGDEYELVNVMDFYNDVTTGIFPGSGIIDVEMTGHSFAQAIGSVQIPTSQFPRFGTFLIRKKSNGISTSLNPKISMNELSISPNPSNGYMRLNSLDEINDFDIFDEAGKMLYSWSNTFKLSNLNLDLSRLPKGVYYLSQKASKVKSPYRIVIQ